MQGPIAPNTWFVISNAHLHLLIPSHSTQVTPPKSYDSTSLIPPRPVPPCSSMFVHVPVLPSSHPTLGLKFLNVFFPAFCPCNMVTSLLNLLYQLFCQPVAVVGLAVFRLGRQFLPRQKDAGSCAVHKRSLRWSQQSQNVSKCLEMSQTFYVGMSLASLSSDISKFNALQRSWLTFFLQWYTSSTSSTFLLDLAYPTTQQLQSLHSLKSW